MTKINVGKNKLTKLDITKIKTHDDSNTGNPAPCGLTELKIGDNEDLKEVSLEYCPNLGEIAAPGCKKLDKVPGLEELKKLKSFIFPEGLFSAVVSKKWKDISKAAGERDQAKQEASSAETERDQLKRQLDEIKSKLGLDNSATQKQILDKIEELQGRPTQDDHNSVKTERDNLQDENNRLKNDDKENKNKVSKRVLVDGTKNWGITLSDKQNEKIQGADSANDVEAARNEIIKDEFDRLQDENKSSTRLNIGLGVLLIVSLLLLGWVVLRQSNLPDAEPKKEKEK